MFYDTLQEMRAGAVVEDDLFQCHDQTASVAGFADLAEGIEPVEYVTLGHAIADINVNLFMVCRRSIFEERAQLFVELLAGAHAGEFDSDILVRPQPR